MRLDILPRNGKAGEHCRLSADSRTRERRATAATHAHATVRLLAQRVVCEIQFWACVCVCVCVCVLHAG